MALTGLDAGVVFLFLRRDADAGDAERRRRRFPAAADRRRGCASSSFHSAANEKKNKHQIELNFFFLNLHFHGIVWPFLVNQFSKIKSRFTEKK